jgi:predicted HicB family RNase H-like nuclease
VTDIARHRGTPTAHGRDGDRQMRLSVSPTLHARLAREAAERGMQLEDWAVLKLGLSRVARSSLAHVQPVSPWRTRC